MTPTMPRLKEPGHFIASFEGDSPRVKVPPRLISGLNIGIGLVYNVRKQI